MNISEKQYLRERDRGCPIFTNNYPWSGGFYFLAVENFLTLSESESESESESQSQRLPRSSLPAADLTAEMETMAQRRGTMDDSFHLPNFPHMAWVGPSALPTIVMMPSLRARLECICSHRLYCTLVSQRVPHPSVISQGRCLTSIGWNVVVDDIPLRVVPER